MAVLRDYTDSELIEKLSMGAEVLFIRLLMVADDYGNLEDKPKVIKSDCFPIKDNIHLADVMGWLSELLTKHVVDTSGKSTSLIRKYEVAGKQYLHINKYKTEKRWPKSKVPGPPHEDEVEDEVEVEVGAEDEATRTRNGECKSFYLRGKSIQQNAGEWLLEQFEKRLEQDFMKYPLDALNLSECLAEFNAEAYMAHYREEMHLFNAFKVFCNKKLKPKNGNNNIKNHRSGHDITAVDTAADDVLRQYSMQHGQGSDTKQ